MGLCVEFGCVVWCCVVLWVECGVEVCGKFCWVVYSDGDVDVLCLINLILVVNCRGGEYVFGRLLWCCFKFCLFCRCGLYCCCWVCCLSCRRML